MASLFEKIKQIIKGKKGSQHLSDNPYSPYRNNFVIKQVLQSCNMKILQKIAATLSFYVY